MMAKRTVFLCAFTLFVLKSGFASCSFTSGSHVGGFDPKTYYIGVEATIPATGTEQICGLPFSTASTGTVVAVQGTVTFRSSCAADALGTVAVNGNTKYYPSKIKIGPNGGAITIFVNYTAPLTFTNSSADINLQAIVANGCSTEGDWEFQGIMQFQ
jgi:hypothetical protein